MQGDVANLEDLDRLFARIKQDKGKLDIVFANAGVARYSSLGEITPELYDSIFNINVKGLLFTVQKALLIPNGGSIILNASIVGSKGCPRTASIRRQSRCAIFCAYMDDRSEGQGIRVNAVSPGSIDTPGLGDLLASSDAGEQRRKFIFNRGSAGRLGKPEGDSQSSSVSRLRRRELRHRDRTVC